MESTHLKPTIDHFNPYEKVIVYASVSQISYFSQIRFFAKQVPTAKNISQCFC